MFMPIRGMMYTRPKIYNSLRADGLFGDGVVDVLCCGGDSLEEDLRWGPGLLA